MTTVTGSIRDTVPSSDVGDPHGSVAEGDAARAAADRPLRHDATRPRVEP